MSTMVTMKFPRGAEREYLTILGIVAIYVATMPTGACIVGSTGDVHRSLQHIRRCSSGAEINFALWVKDRRAADAIVREVNSPGHRAETSADLVQQIRMVAEALNIPVTEHDVVMARVSAAVELIERKIAEASRSGELKWFNEAYRTWRMSRGRAMTYRAARARLRKAVMQSGLSADGAMTRELLPAIFHQN